MLVPDTEASISDAQSVFPSSSLVCFIFQSAPVDTAQIIAAAEWTLGLLLQFSLLVSLFYVL